MSSTISPVTRTILNRLQQFKPPYQPVAGADCAWSAIPWQRRASVLVLLFESRTSNSTVTLSTVLTLRSASLSSFSGQVALPGGKSDSDKESVYAVARREAFEEIGLPLDDPSIEYIATLPTYLARNMLAVQPTIAYIRSKPGTAPEDLPAAFHSDSIPQVLEPIGKRLKELKRMMPDNTEEVAEVFSVPLPEFLYRYTSTGTNKEWHRYKQVRWGSLRWPMHDFSVVRENKQIGDPAFFS
jgi:8-oxo-dGTP pyrophosphatase MutT (NUDIX family)